MLRSALSLAAAALIIVVGLMAGGISRGLAAPTAYTMQPGETLHIVCTSGLTGVVGQGTAELACATLAPATLTMTATTTPTVAATHTHTPGPVTDPPGWHAPTTHEHGESPQQWVLDSPQQPFTQTRESHTGYKGMRATAVDNAAVQSYIITHILTAESARSHGDHDYQLWVRDSTGAVSYWEGVLPFGQDANVPSSPIFKSKADNGQRPIALAERNATDGCETWYSRPGRLVFDLGWTVCDRYQKFDGTILNGEGKFRSADWFIYPERLTRPGGHVEPTLARECRVQYGSCRIGFIRTGHDNPGPQVVPIN